MASKIQIICPNTDCGISMEIEGDQSTLHGAEVGCPKCGTSIKLTFPSDEQSPDNPKEHQSETKIQNDCGYVYILTNPSMTGIIKIGKTNKHPSGRAIQLHSTGVPTPFEVAYHVYVDNCSKLEAYLHTALEQKGLRVASNREFFRVGISEVTTLIEAYIETNNDEDIAPQSDEMSFLQQGKRLLDEAKQNNGRGTNEAVEMFKKAAELGNGEACMHLYDCYLGDSDIKPWGNPIPYDVKEAEKWLHQGASLGNIDCYMMLALRLQIGARDVFQDSDAAISYYKQAASLGSDKACRALAEMYLDNNDIKKAKQWLMEGESRGNLSCYPILATKIFAEQGDIHNANKCWMKLFSHPKYLTEDDEAYLAEYIIFETYYGKKWCCLEILLKLDANRKIKLIKHLEKELVGLDTPGDMFYCEGNHEIREAFIRDLEESLSAEEVELLCDMRNSYEWNDGLKKRKEAADAVRSLREQWFKKT